jgi:hypothetical protein
MSVTHKVAPRLRRPLGALRPVTHFALTILPSGESREMYPFPSFSRIWPLIEDTKIAFEAAS